MKRSLTVLAGMVLILSAAACSNDSSTPAPAPSSKVTATPTSAPHDQPTTSAPQPPPAPTTTGKRGADGSTGNNLSDEYCAKNQDPGCPRGSYVGPNAIQNPNGDGTWVPCEGTICTNPNHGAGPETAPAPGPDTTTEPPVTTTEPPAPGPGPEGAACGTDGDGHWVHLDGDNAKHYGTEWLCQH